MKRYLLSASLVLLLNLALTACGAAETAPPALPATATAAAGQPADPGTIGAEPVNAVTASPISPTPTTVAAAPSAEPSPTTRPLPSPTPTPAPVPSDTPLPPDTPTPTAVPVPQVRVNDTLTTPVNVRSGPGTVYPIIGRFQPGETAPVTGRNQDASWWQVDLAGSGNTSTPGWVAGELVSMAGDSAAIPLVEAPPPPPSPTPAPAVEAAPPPAETGGDMTGQQLAEQLSCGKDFCVTYQAMVPIWENGGCIGNHSIYITVLQGLPPGQPMDGVVIGDTFNNVDVASGSNGPGRTEITLWNNSMTLIAKRHIDGTPYTSEESFNFTAHDELIPAEVLAANGYCDGSIEKCEVARNNNQVCRGHYSWRVTFHKFN